MARYNKKRKREFKDALAQYEGDQLATARVAYLNGTATPDQTLMVEEATRIAKEKGFKLPPLLTSSATSEAAFPTASQPQPTFKVPIIKAELPRPDLSKATEQKPTRTWKEWWFSSLKKQEEGDDVGSSERRLGWDSLSEEDDGAGIRESDIVRAVEDKAEYLKLKAKQAFESEREKQRKGGALDQVGLDKKPSEAPKKGWW